MAEHVMKQSKNIVKSCVSTSALGVKPSSSFSVTVPSQNNKEKKLVRKPPIEVRQTKTSTQRKLLANPLLEPKNVQFLEDIQRRETICVENSQSGKLNVPKIIDKNTHKDHMLKMMTEYDLNGRRLTMHVSDDCETAERGSNQNNVKFYQSNKPTHFTKHSKTESQVKNVQTQSHFNNKSTRSNSCSDINNRTVKKKFLHTCNKELAEFEKKYCNTIIDDSMLKNKPSVSNKKRETLTLYNGKLPSSYLQATQRMVPYLKKNTNASKPIPRKSNCRQTMILTKNKPASMHPSKVNTNLNKRKSLSQDDLSKKETISIKRRSSSTEDLNSKRKQVTFISPIIEETSPFLTDLSRSEPRRSNRPTVSTPRYGLSTSCSERKRNKLLQWLSEKGKPLSSYRHLQCFNISESGQKHPLQRRIDTNSTQVLDNLYSQENENSPLPIESKVIDEVSDEYNDENKENIDIISPEGKTKLDESELQKVTCEALLDLRNLVKAGYDHEECDAWMQALRKHYPKIHDCVEYWECLASLDEVKGDYSMAVDSYQRAIVRGAEVHDVSEQLDGLLIKMNHLHLETPQKDMKSRVPKDKVDIKNIFKSKVIQFALQQKEVKKLSNDLGKNTQVLYVATPVRRSTRKNVIDPKCLRTLDDLEPEKRCLTEFQPNPALE